MQQTTIANIDSCALAGSLPEPVCRALAGEPAQSWQASTEQVEPSASTNITLKAGRSKSKRKSSSSGNSSASSNSFTDGLADSQSEAYCDLRSWRSLDDSSLPRPKALDAHKCVNSLDLSGSQLLFSQQANKSKSEGIAVARNNTFALGGAEINIADSRLDGGSRRGARRGRGCAERNSGSGSSSGNNNRAATDCCNHRARQCANTITSNQLYTCHKQQPLADGERPRLRHEHSSWSSLRLCGSSSSSTSSSSSLSSSLQGVCALVLEHGATNSRSMGENRSKLAPRQPRMTTNKNDRNSCSCSCRCIVRTRIRRTTINNIAVDCDSTANITAATTTALTSDRWQANRPLAATNKLALFSNNRDAKAKQHQQTVSCDIHTTQTDERDGDDNNNNTTSDLQLIKHIANSQQPVSPISSTCSEGSLSYVLSSPSPGATSAPAPTTAEQAATPTSVPSSRDSISSSSVASSDASDHLVVSEIINSHLYLSETETDFEEDPQQRSPLSRLQHRATLPADFHLNVIQLKAQNSQQESHQSSNKSKVDQPSAPTNELQQAARSSNKEAMEILQQHLSQDDRLRNFTTTTNNTLATRNEDKNFNSPPKFYPNNTLIADLNECHGDISNLFWPQTSRATAPTLSSLMRWPWISGRRRHLGSCGVKSRYSFLMPESLLRTNSKLKLDDYDKALSVLTSDVRYQLHLLLYRRVQTIWMLLSTILCILVPVALTNLESFIILTAGLLWISLQIIGVFVSAQFRQKLDQMLEKSVAQVNTFFMDYNLMLGVINVGSLLSKAKLMIPMLYFDTSQCREQIESIISIDSRKDADGNDNKHILDYSKIDLPLTEPNVMASAQSEQQLAKKIVLRYSQRWISYFDKRKLMFTDDRVRPRHLSTGKCLCQFIEEHFRNNAQKCLEKVKHNQSNNISSYANTNAPILVPNGKQKQQQPKPTKQQDEQVETQVRPPQVIRKCTQMAPTIPTLSRLVSMKESSNHQHIKIDMSPAQSPLDSLQSNGCQVNGFAKHLWGPSQSLSDTGEFQNSMYNNNNNNHHHNHHHLDRTTAVKADQHSNSQSQSSVSHPDLSLGMGSDLLGNGDDLVKRLRLLLELRKNELQGLDGSLFSGALYRVSNQFGLLNEDHQATSETQNTYSSDNDTTDNVKHTGEKKFFNQRDGLFFFGAKNGKKSQQQQPNRANHVLEIC